MEILRWLAILAAGYIVGSINTAYLAGRLLYGVDIRTLGDRNAGAANAYRVLGPRVGIAVALVDVGKGAAMVVLSGILVGASGAAMLAGFAVAAGHNWPLFLGFRGGRGAATTLGVLATMMPWLVLPLTALAAVPLLLTRSTTATLAFIYGLIPFVNWWRDLYPVSLIWYAVGLCSVVAVTHFLTIWHVWPDAEPEQPTSS